MRGRSSGKTAPPVPGLTWVGGGAKMPRDSRIGNNLGYTQHEKACFSLFLFGLL